MKRVKRTWRAAIFAGSLLLAATGAVADERNDSIATERAGRPVPARRFLHRIELEGRAGYLFPTSSFLKGEGNGYYLDYDAAGNPIHPSHAVRAALLKYSFQSRPGTAADRAYGGAYQGIGIGLFDLGRPEELGTPVGVYVFQGARLARLLPRLSLNYEWNFGLSVGWHPYDRETNPDNTTVGSRANAYLNAGLYLSWMLTPGIDLNIGGTASHFSNGNTKYPNSGVNTASFKVGVAYHFNRRREEWLRAADGQATPFTRHVSYDLTLFGSWRRKAVNVGEGQIPAPGKYAVAGFSLAPMYNVGYKFRAGVALDGVYDASNGIRALNGTYSETEEDFSTPAVRDQLSLGLSGRAEWVMPYFTVGVGLGANILHGGNDMKAFYQILALKMELTSDSYLHVGYNLKNFHEPNYLMLGIGYRFNNKRPRL